MEQEYYSFLPAQNETQRIQAGDNALSFLPVLSIYIIWQYSVQFSSCLTVDFLILRRNDHSQISTCLEIMEIKAGREGKGIESIIRTIANLLLTSEL